MFNRYPIIALCFSVLLWCSFGCGGGTAPAELPGTVGEELGHKPGPGDAPKFASVTTFTGEYEDSVPDGWTWDMIHGQTMFLGTATIVLDGGVYYMHYELSDAAIAAGWGYCDAAVDIETNPANFPKNGSPGQFEWKWDWSPVHPNTPPTSLHLALTGWTPPAGEFYVAIHATVCKGSWVQNEETLVWSWVETTNETGWGGLWDSKATDGSVHWYGNWSKKWGGYAYTGDLSRYPIFDPFNKTYYTGNVYGTFSYWDVYFNDNSAGSFGFTPAYHQANPWQAWCTDPRYLAAFTTVHVDVYSCYDPDLPDYAKSGNWDLISFMINERRNPTAGGPFAGVDWNNNGNKQAFQDAVWYFKYGPEDPWYATTADNNWFVTLADGSLAEQFADYAIANGENYFPRDGQWYAAVLFPVSPFGYSGQRSAELPVGFQTNIIEVDP